MSRAEEIKHLLEVSRKMRVDKTWPMTEDEVIEFISSSFEFGFVCGALWQKQQDRSTIELAEDHAYFAGKTKTIDEIKEALLSEVLPYFMHGGEADEVVSKLDEVLNQKK